MPAYSAPGLYYETVDASRRRVPAVRTDVAAFVGVAEKGPLHTPTVIQSWAQFQARFGNFLEGPFLAYGVKGFFENGGDQCKIVRVAAPEAEAVLDLESPQPADRSYSIVDTATGFAPGAVVTVSQDRQTWDVLLAAVDAVARQLTWSRPLDPAYNPALGAGFATGAGSARGVLLTPSGDPTLQISAESPGYWGNSLAAQIARTSTYATRTRAGVAQPADRASSFVETVAGLRPFTLLKVFQDLSPAPSVETWHLAAAVDVFDTRIEWDAPLEAGFDLTKPIAVESLEFSISVYDAGILREVFPQLSLVPEHERYAPNAIQAGTSSLIRVTDLGAPGPPQDRIPDVLAPNLDRARLYLEGGRNGTAALTVDDFLGDPAASTRTGLRTLELVSGIGMVAIPDLLMQPAPPVEFAPPPRTPPDPCGLCPPPPREVPPLAPVLRERIPGFSLDEIFRAQETLIEHCQTMQYRIALLDPPLFSKPKEAVDVAQIQSWRQRFDSSFGALIFPWLLVYDPLQPASRLLRAVPPSGHAAGVYAGSDLERGVHWAPANRPVRWAQDVMFRLDAGVQAALNPLGINCIRVFPGHGLLLYGARTLSSKPRWIFVNVRRLLCMIEESLDAASQWAVFEPNDARLQKLMTMAITTFLDGQWKRGALKGQRVEEVFYVKCDARNNTPDLAAQGRLLAEVGVAPVIPADFVVVRVGRTRDTLEISECEMTR
jgi:phage tail sheath protein FI